MRKQITITPEIIAEAKQLIAIIGIKPAAKKLKVSSYTTHAIAHGKYDTTDKLRDRDKRCPITGFKL